MNPAPQLAMAGMAEAYAQAALFIAWCGLVLIAVLLIIGLHTRSWIPTIVGVGLWLLFTLLVQPWRAFALIETYSEDPDVQHWADADRRMAIGWIIVSLATVGSVIALRVLKKVSTPTPGEERQNIREQASKGRACGPFE